MTPVLRAAGPGTDDVDIGDDAVTIRMEYFPDVVRQAIEGRQGAARTVEWKVAARVHSVLGAGQASIASSPRARESESEHQAYPLLRSQVDAQRIPLPGP